LTLLTPDGLTRMIELSGRDDSFSRYGYISWVWQTDRQRDTD